MTSDVQFCHQNHKVPGVISSAGGSSGSLGLTGTVRPSLVACHTLRVELKFSDLETGEIRHTKAGENMSRHACGGGGGGAELDLKLNLSPPMVDPITESPTESLSVSPASSSCLSLEVNSGEPSSLAHSSGDGPAVTPMVLVGCPRCLMYVMIAEEVHPKCPKCKSTVLLDILHGKPKVVGDPKLDKKAP